MPIRSSKTTWGGNTEYGIGIIKVGKTSLKGYYTQASRYKDGKGINPEELIGAAHASCFAMTLTCELTHKGYKPDSVDVVAMVNLETAGSGPAITHIKLVVEAEVPGIDEDTFQLFVKQARNNSPVSRVLAGTEMKISARLS